MSRVTKTVTCSLRDITVKVTNAEVISIDCTCCGEQLHYVPSGPSTMDFIEINEIAVAHINEALFARRAKPAPAFKPAPVRWIRNKGSDISHAYAPGPGMGDSPLCGRTTFHGIEMPDNGNNCAVCTTLVPTFKG